MIGKILITGGNGFIGSNLKGDYKISRNDCDLTDYNKTHSIFKNYSPNTVIHTAAKHGSSIKMRSNFSEYLNNNIMTDINVIKICNDLDVENLLMMSTISSFRKDTKYPMTEEYFEGDVNESFFGYNYSKKICVGLCKSYQLDYNKNYKSVFLGNVYGPNNKFNDNATVISNLIYKFVEANKKNTDVKLFGNGNNTRNFIYVDDLNYIFEKIILDKNIKTPIIISSPYETKIKDLVEIIVDEINFKGKVIYDTSINIGDDIKTTNIEKLTSVIEDFKFTNIETGLKKTIISYINNLK